MSSSDIPPNTTGIHRPSAVNWKVIWLACDGPPEGEAEALIWQVKMNFESILDRFSGNANMGRIVSKYMVKKSITQIQRERVREFLWKCLHAPDFQDTSDSYGNEWGSFNKRLEELWKQVRKSVLGELWCKFPQSVDTVFVPFIQEFTRHYSEIVDQSGDLEDDTWDYRVWGGFSDDYDEDSEYQYDEPMVHINSADRAHLLMIINSVWAYFDAMDTLRNEGVVSRKEMLLSEKKNGSWDWVTKVMTEIKNIFLTIEMYDYLELYYWILFDKIKNLIQRHNTYELLHRL